MVDQERLNYLSDKFSKMDEEIIIEVNKDGIDVWGDPNRRFRKLLKKDLRKILRLNSISWRKEMKSNGNWLEDNQI